MQDPEPGADSAAGTQDDGDAGSAVRGERLIPPGRAGFTLLELMVVTVIVAVLASFVGPRVRAVQVKAHVNSVVADARILYHGFQEFYAQNLIFPNASSAPKFDIVTFEPLRSMGFYQGNMLERLRNNRADAFDSPDDQGTNQEFWLQMTLKIDPSYQVVVASSDNAPLASGTWLDGVYVFHNGQLVAGPGVDTGG